MPESQRHLSRFPSARRLVRMLAALGAPLVLVAAPRATAAQALSGRVVDSASTQPIPGAVIQTLAADGSVRTSTLSDAQGAFSLRLADADAQLKVLRIGFRPRVLPRPAASAGPVLVSLVRIPVFLDPVRVVAAARCRRRGRTSPVGLLEQARAGLLASVVARGVTPARMQRLAYERRDDPDGTLVHHRVRGDSGTDTRSFRAVDDAAGFVRRGFLETGDGEQTFFAPDAETLLDASFAAGYCFVVMPEDRNRPHQVGLGFLPADRRRGRVDIDGALWIDTVARELRELEFWYDGLPTSVELRLPGGRVEFTSLPNGVTLVTSWHLNLVGLAVDSVPGRRPGTWVRRQRLFRHETGGQLARADWPDGTSWRAPLGTLRARVTWPDGAPARGVRYALRGTPFEGITDPSGDLTIGDILPGRYELLVADEPLASLGLSLPADVAVEVERDTTRADLRARPVDDYARDRCRAFEWHDPAADTTFVVARAVWADGTPVEDARWRARQREGEEWVDLGFEGRTGSDGVMPVCHGLVRGRDIELDITAPNGLRHIERASLSASTTVRLIGFPRP